MIAWKLQNTFLDNKSQAQQYDSWNNWIIYLIWFPQLYIQTSVLPKYHHWSMFSWVEIRTHSLCHFLQSRGDAGLTDFTTFVSIWNILGGDNDSQTSTTYCWKFVTCSLFMKYHNFLFNIKWQVQLAIAKHRKYAYYTTATSP